MDKRFSGIWTAIITPMKANGEIDWKSFDKLIDYQLDFGITGLVVNGTTAEASTLSIQERLTLIRRAKAKIENNLLIMAGCTLAGTKETIELCKLSEEAGADCLLIAPPAYTKPSFNGLLNHFTKICENTLSPLFFYNVPQRTAVNLSVVEISEILKLNSIVGIKEASGDVTKLSMIRIENPDTILLTGDDASFLPSLSVGAQGNISVLSNAYPKFMVDLMQSFKAGDFSTSLSIHQQLAAITQLLFEESNPSPIKSLLHQAFGIGENSLRAPLAICDTELSKRLLDCHKLIEI